MKAPTTLPFCWSILAILLSVSCRAVDPLGPVSLEFNDSWGALDRNGEAVERTWPGADWHATRQEDWRIGHGWVHCSNSKAPTSGRTLALLTRTIEGPITETVSLGLKIAAPGGDDDGVWKPGAHVGLLFGVGGPEVHYKRSAMVQQAPAADGGWLLSVNHEGRLRISSFHDPLERSGYWTLPRGVDFDALPVLAESKGRVILDQGPLDLQLIYEPNRGGGQAPSGRLSVVVGPFVGASAGYQSMHLENFPEADLVGSLSLFSALGASGSPNGFAFKDFDLRGATAHPDRALGPILAATYLVDRSEDAPDGSVLRLTAHVAALGEADTKSAKLWLKGEEGWYVGARGKRTADGSDLICFEVADYQDLTGGEDRPYRIELDLAKGDSLIHAIGGSRSGAFEGLIRSEPAENQEWVLASLSCLKNQVGPIAWNQSGLWFPHEQLVSRVTAQDPDLLYFSGDQIYEGDLTGPNRRDLEISIADYQTKYRRFLWAFSDLLKDRPSVLVPDDHDVFHGNLWGAGGVRAKKREGLSVQDSGGYRMPAKFVNVVHASLTSHLPPSKVSARIGMGITTYTTDFTWGGVDFAVLADRMWKDSPSVMVPKAKFRNGWIQAEGVAVADTDNAEAQLLGAEQEAFLAGWAGNQDPQTWTRVVLSQSPFACLHSLPADTKSDSVVGRQKPPAPGQYPENDAPVSDGDSNGWPQSARDRAVALLAQANALHLCGDQHLGTVGWYGLEAWREGTVAFTSPAMGNTWPRRWMPKEPGAGRPVDSEGRPTTPRYTGDYLDGFGNRVTMLAVANPEENGLEPVLQMNRAPGFGLVRFQPDRDGMLLEAWPTWDSDRMYPGWPLRVDSKARPVGGGW